MNSYPYYIVVAKTGRLETPIQYKHTPIDKLFKSGKIGGLRTEEIIANTPQEAQQRGFLEERRGKTVEILKVRAFNRPRENCPLWRQQNWMG